MEASSPPRIVRMPELSRLGWIMGLYGENHRRIVRLFDPAMLEVGGYVSSIGDGIDVHLGIVEQHRYTTELCLSYAMRDPVTGQPDPSVCVRVYHDAGQAEATHCYVGKRWQDVIGMHPTPQVMFGYRLRMNTFLGKWLQYLEERGHGRGTLVQVDTLPQGEAEVACAG